MKIRSFSSAKLSIVLLVALLSAYTFVAMTRNCFSSAMVFIVEEGLLTKFQTGIITAVFYVVYGILQFFGGMIIDRMKPERFVTIGLVGTGICNLIIFFNQQYAVMLVCWGLSAFVQLGVWPAVFKMVSTMPLPGMRTNALFVATLGAPASIVMGYGVAAIVGSAWRLNFLISAIGLAAFAIAWEIIAHIILPKADEVEPDVKAEIDSDTKVDFKKLVVKSGLIIVFILPFFRSLIDSAVKGLTPTMINETYAEVTSVFATVMNIVVLIAGVLGIFIAYFIYPRFIQNESIVMAIFFAISLPLICVVLLIGKLHYWVIISLLSLILLMMSGCTLFTTSYIASRFNRIGKGATVAGILNASASIGTVVANSVLPAIADSLGWMAVITTMIVLIAVSFGITIVCVPIWTKFLKKR